MEEEEEEEEEDLKWKTNRLTMEEASFFGAKDNCITEVMSGGFRGWRDNFFFFLGSA